MEFYGLAATLTSKLLPLIQAILGFSAVLIIHECGHFFFCKLFGIETPTFSIGMGPTILRGRFGRTNFRLAALPIGGSVEVLVEEPQRSNDGREENIGHSLESKPYWQKILVMLGGILLNLTFALITFSALFWSGMPQTSLKKLESISVKEVSKNSAAFKTGIKTGDVITGINGKDFSDSIISLEEFLDAITGQAGLRTTNTLTVARDNKTLTLPITMPTKKADESSAQFGITFLADGTYEQTTMPPLSLTESLKKGVQMTVEQIAGIGKAIKSALQQQSVKGLGGPLAIFSFSMKSAQRGTVTLLLFLAILSINLALLNLLPFGVLDGGRVLFFTIEAIIGRPVPEIIQIAVNGFSFIAISTLLILLTYRDILAIWFK